MTYKIWVTDYQPVDLSREDVVTIAEAAKALGLTMPGVIRAIERGVLTEVIDDNASYHGRRLLLRAEVNQLVEQKNPGQEQQVAPADSAETVMPVSLRTVASARPASLIFKT